jgi:toxin FitB
MAGKTKPATALVLDTSCWLEVFDGSERAALYHKQAANIEQLIVPVITIYEVFKLLKRSVSYDAALRAATYLQRGLVVDIDAGLAMEAASNGLPLADSLIYATAQLHSAVLWTQDAHFEGLPGVKFFSKSSAH